MISPTYRRYDCQTQFGLCTCYSDFGHAAVAGGLRPVLHSTVKCGMDETQQHPGCARGSTRTIPLCCNVSKLKRVLMRPRRARVDGDHRVLVAPILWAREATRIPHARERPARKQTRPLPIDVRKRHFCDIDGLNTLAKSVASSRQPS